MRHVQNVVSKLQRCICLKDFRRDVRGSVATIFGMASIPLITAAGIAIDFNRTIDAQSSLQTLADRAALAGAAHKGDVDEQLAAAETFLENAVMTIGGVNYSYVVSPTVEDDINVSITANVEGTLMPVAFGLQSGDGAGQGASGNADLTIDATARAVTTPGQLLCVVSLNANAANAIEFKGTSAVSAEGCGFHVNSSHASALYRNGNTVTTADFFNVVGGYVSNGNGSFSETPDTGEQFISDPLNKSVTCPSSAGASSPALSNGAVLTATKYNNLNLGSNKSVTLDPSVGTDIYVFGTITVRNNSTLITDGKTIVLCGANAKFEMTGGEIQLLAPTTGANAGYAVVASASATATSTITGGTNTYIRGIWYTPKGSLSVSGGGIFNLNSKYFPIIVDKLSTVGTAGINIEMDWAAYGFSKPVELITEEYNEVYLVH